jgi:hypothetical protein
MLEPRGDLRSDCNIRLPKRLLNGRRQRPAKDRKAYLRSLLYPGRFCYSWTTGLMGSNGDAVAFLHENRIAGLDLGLIARALQLRQAGADPDPLFADRTQLPHQIEVCAALAVG